MSCQVTREFVSGFPVWYSIGYYSASWNDNDDEPSISVLLGESIEIRTATIFYNEQYKIVLMRID